MGDSNSIINDVEWLNESVPYLNKYNWFYKLICFFMGRRKRKLTYWELYLISYGANRGKHISEEEVKKYAMLKTLELYKFHHNNKLPKGVKYDD